MLNNKPISHLPSENPDKNQHPTPATEMAAPDSSRLFEVKPSSSVGADWSALKKLLGSTQEYLQTAQVRAEIREKWPDTLERSPFTLLKPLKSLFLKVLQLIFKDQREVNQNLIQVCQQSIQFNQELMEQLVTLSSQIDQLHQSRNNQQITLEMMDNHLTDIEAETELLPSDTASFDPLNPQLTATAVNLPAPQLLTPEPEQLPVQLELESWEPTPEQCEAAMKMFQAYKFCQGGAVEYFQTHVKRYLTTLELIPRQKGLRILELGSCPAFSLLLKQKFPDATIILAYNDSPDEKTLEDNSEGKLAQDKFQKRSSQDGRDKYNQQLFNYPFSVIESEPQSADWPIYRFSYTYFNIEKDIWPFEDKHFDVVFCMEILEHLLVDPGFSFREANRVLKDGGTFIVTTPNIARYESVDSILSGDTPYTFGIYYESGPYGRHNREYVPREVSRLGECSGFQTDLLLTANVYPLSRDIRLVQELLAQFNDDPTLRKQNILYRGIKVTDQFKSYPPELYG
jgi:SAM-dependent methyltransferase